jgi:putative YphP/YqiW family bacilliredoxin
VTCPLFPRPGSWRGKLGGMPYPEMLIKPMREDLTQYGVQETRTPEQLDEVIRTTNGTVMVIVNSVCGCAAGLARPGIGIALKHSVVPDKVVTVFAGADIAATERARSYFKGYFPSSPSVGLLQNGRIVFMLERHQVEGRDPNSIANDLMAAFDRFCVPSLKT